MADLVILLLLSLRFFLPPIPVCPLLSSSSQRCTFSFSPVLIGSAPFPPPLHRLSRIIVFLSLYSLSFFPSFTLFLRLSPCHPMRLTHAPQLLNLEADTGRERKRVR